ncbi:putative 4-coumarate--CoA ligase [Dioscorea sansibarensis]
MEKLPKCGANYTPLSPVTFLKRASMVYSHRTSILYKSTLFTWNQTHERCLRLASSLRSMGITRNDVVSVLAPNIPAMYEMHFGVPMAGAVLNTINTRLDAANVATLLAHSEAKLLFVDYQFVPLARQALCHLPSLAAPPTVIVIDEIDDPTGIRMDGGLEYEQLISCGNPDEAPYELEDEWDAIALNYTSGTTSAPKGVVYSHRGAYLSVMSLLLQWGVGNEPVYLWSLPMFHCNGWTFTWGMAARGGTNVCIRTTSSAEIYCAISDHGVTHMCCAPVVFNIILEACPTDRRPITTRVEVLTGGAPPPAALLEKIEQSGFHVTHAYGMTEATGPALVCEWWAEWDLRPAEERAGLKARQGISALALEEVDVKDVKSMESVPRDGRSLGEVVLRGSNVMKGYFKNEKDTNAAFKGGWFLTGDVGVIHPDGYLEIKDRSKDVIISGGENISSVEVETVLYRHPMVVEAAVVAMPHPRWGETPCAFVALARDHEGGEQQRVREEEEIINHCKNNMARFMAPKKVVFMKELPKTSTGKILKFELREMARNMKTLELTTPPATWTKKRLIGSQDNVETLPAPITT